MDDTPAPAPADLPGTGRVAVVVGASSGIGRATAIALATQGWTLVLASRSPEALAAAGRDCRAAVTRRGGGSGTVEVVPTDVLDPQAVDALLDGTVARCGRVDAVVHTAAVIGYGRFEDVPAAEFDRAVSTNLLGTATVSRAALRVFRSAGHGHLVLLGSLLGKVAVPFMSPYVVGKWGVHALARTLQQETRDAPGIHVSLVSPGGVDTPAYLQAANRVGREGRPPPPVDSPERVARVILGVLRRPRRERSVGPANPVIVAGFRLLPAVFDVLVTPLMSVLALSRREIPRHGGNVAAPQPEGEAVHGVWNRLGLRREPR